MNETPVMAGAQDIKYDGYSLLLREAANALAAERARADEAESELTAVLTSETGPRTPNAGISSVEPTAESEPQDALNDPANTQVIAALRALRPYFAPPVHEDKVIAMLRERGVLNPVIPAAEQ